MPLSHSLKKRFIYKLGGNIAALALGVIALAVVSRALGPADFGRFEFLTANFKLVLDTLALQLPIAYFNWISRKQAPGADRPVESEPCGVIGVFLVPFA